MDAKYYAHFSKDMPSEGGVVVLHYPNSSPENEWHVATVLELSEKGFRIGECNYREGLCNERFIPWNHPSIYSFWTPPPAPRRIYAMVE